jgi:hypothetical protein
VGVNRAQIERAEKVADFLNQRRQLTQDRLEAARREELLVQLETNLSEEYRKARAVQAYKVQQMRKFEARRQAVEAFLIAQEVLDESDVIGEPSQRPYKRPRDENQVEFTQAQLEIAERWAANL